jgi:hypothetical protein
MSQCCPRDPIFCRYFKAHNCRISQIAWSSNSSLGLWDEFKLVVSKYVFDVLLANSNIFPHSSGWLNLLNTYQRNGKTSCYMCLPHHLFHLDFCIITVNARAGQSLHYECSTKHIVPYLWFVNWFICKSYISFVLKCKQVQLGVWKASHLAKVLFTSKVNWWGWKTICSHLLFLSWVLLLLGNKLTYCCTLLMVH